MRTQERRGLNTKPALPYAEMNTGYCTLSTDKKTPLFLGGIL